MNIMFNFISNFVSHNIDNLKPPIIMIIWYDVEGIKTLGDGNNAYVYVE